MQVGDGVLYEETPTLAEHTTGRTRISLTFALMSTTATILYNFLLESKVVTIGRFNTYLESKGLNPVSEEVYEMCTREIASISKEELPE